MLIIAYFSYIRPLSSNNFQFDPMISHSGHSRHLRSIRFLLLPFDRMEIKYWWWSQCVSFAWTYRPICNMPYWLTTWPPVAMTFYGQDANISTRQEEYDDLRIMPLVFLLQKYSRKPFLPKTTIYIFRDLYSLSCWSYNISGAIPTKEQLKSYRALLLQRTTYNRFWNNATFPKKYGISPNNLGSGDLWWTHY